MRASGISYIRIRDANWQSHAHGVLSLVTVGFGKPWGLLTLISHGIYSYPAIGKY